MKNILLLFILFTGLISWGQSPEYLYYDNGDVMCKVWRDGNHQVTKRETYQEQNQGGKLKKVENYKSGEPHGVQKTYFDSGMLSSIENFEYGKSHGVDQSWNNDGSIKFEIHHNKGIPVKKTIYTYYSSNRLKLIKNYSYKGGWYNDGLWKYYYKGLNNILEKEEHYIDGKLKVTHYYYKNGQIKSEDDKEYYESGIIKRDGDKKFDHNGIEIPTYDTLKDYVMSIWDQTQDGEGWKKCDNYNPTIFDNTTEEGQEEYNWFWVSFGENFNDFTKKNEMTYESMVDEAWEWLGMTKNNYCK